jgi:hypothetical protein
LGLARTIWFWLLLLLPLPASAKSAVPIDPVTGILDAFKDHSIVALGEGDHGNLPGHAFRLSLLRDPRFAGTVNDIVVEMGQSAYQDVMDRFTNGENVPYDDLKKCWQDTTQANFTADLPIYEEMFRAVRTVNQGLPPAKRVRVLLGDPPLDWSKVHSAADYQKLFHRLDNSTVAIIQREVLARNRRALIVYGDVHFWRKNAYWPLPDREKAEKDFSATPNSIVALLEKDGAKVFSIHTNADAGVDFSKLQPDVASWRAPSLALLRGTTLGAASFAFFYPHQMMIFWRDGSNQLLSETIGPDPTRSPRLEDEFDALLYLGPPASITKSHLTTEKCSDASYMAMRRQRLEWGSGMGMGDAASLDRECARAMAGRKPPPPAK